MEDIKDYKFLYIDGHEIAYVFNTMYVGFFVDIRGIVCQAKTVEKLEERLRGAFNKWKRIQIIKNN